VPDFRNRFWVYQVVDLRTDGSAQLGKMCGPTPGHYLRAGPDWNGDVLNGITQVFRRPTRTGFLIPRVFQEKFVDELAAMLADAPPLPREEAR